MATMRVDIRIVYMDGTPDGVVLYMAEDVPPGAVPEEYGRLRIHNREGLWEVVEGGVLRYYHTDAVRVSVVVEPVMVESAVVEDESSDL